MENFNKNIPPHLHHHLHPHLHLRPHSRFQGRPQQQQQHQQQQQQQHAPCRNAPVLMPLPPFQQIAQAPRQSPPQAYHEPAMMGHQHQHQQPEAATANTVNDNNNNAVNLTVGNPDGDESNATVMMNGATAFFEQLANSGNANIFQNFESMVQGLLGFYQYLKNTEKRMEDERNLYHQRIEIAKTNYQNTRMELENAEANYQDTQVELENAKANGLSLQAVVNQCKKNDAKNQRMIQNLNQENERLLAYEKSSIIKVTAMEAEIKQLKMDVKTLTSERDSVKNENANINGRLNKVTQERDKLVTKNDEKKKANESLSSQLKQLKETQAEKDREDLHTGELWADCRRKLEAAEKTLDTTKTMLDHEVRVKEELKETIMGMENDLRFELGKVESLMQERKNLDNKIRMAENEVQEEKTKNLKLRKTINQFEIVFETAWDIIKDQCKSQDDKDEAKLSELEGKYAKKRTKSIFTVTDMCEESGEEQEQEEESSSDTSSEDSYYSMPALEKFGTESVSVMQQNIPPQDTENENENENKKENEGENENENENENKKENENENDSTSVLPPSNGTGRKRSCSGRSGENLSVKISRKGSPTSEWKIADV